MKIYMFIFTLALVLMPPESLSQGISGSKQPFDIQNTYILTITLGCTLLVSAILFFIKSGFKKRNEIFVYQKLIGIHEPEESGQKQLPPHSLEKNTAVIKKDLISKETEETLIKKLERFERGTKFTDKNMSMSMLGGILGTNIKYLNYIISKHRNRNFNQYINYLRIDYIVQKMENSPEYLQYKISIMAEECGYSSHGKFTEAFKKEIGLNPSAFIELMQKERKRGSKTDDIKKESQQ